MAKDRSSSSDFTGPLRRLLLAVLVLALTGIFLLWRIDSPRVERFRAQVTDRFVPNLDWAMAPVTGTINLLRDCPLYPSAAADERSRVGLGGRRNFTKKQATAQQPIDNITNRTK